MKSSSFTQANITINFSQDINDVRALRGQMEAKDIFLSYGYLSALQTSMADAMDFYYLVFSNNEKVVGVAYCQIAPFSVAKSFKLSSGAKNKLWGPFKKWMADQVNFKIFVCGNLLLTGPHGYHFSESMPKDAHHRVVRGALSHVFQRAVEMDPSIKVEFIKDLDSASLVNSELATSRGYYKFRVQPNMVLSLHRDWEDFEDYTGALKSKYRIRLRKAMMKGAGLTLRKMDLTEIHARQDQLFQLYRQVVENADFQMTDLSRAYLYALKSNLKEQFTITGYYQEDKLIGFMSFLDNGNKLEAHFTGFSVSLNKKFDLYLNMLIDLVREAFQLKKEQLVLGRTALEIKSSIGAQPTSLTGFLKHRQPIINLILPTLFRYFYKQEDWNQRKPFKKTDNMLNSDSIIC